MKPLSALEQIHHHFEQWQGSAPKRIEALNASSGSNRQYFSILSETNTHYIGTVNADVTENEAFFYYARFFRNKGIRLPEVYYISADRQCYIQEDIGQISLMQLLKSQGESDMVLSYYKQSLEMLWQMQSQIDNINFSVSYPRPAFDNRSVLWDLNYFKYYFLKLQNLTFHENDLENDFWALAQTISQLPSNRFFMFRDFQARNIHIHNDKVWFIDFQGGRQGPPLYDVVSLLYQSSARLSAEWQHILKNHYKALAIDGLQYSEVDFETDFVLMRLIRSLQTLGAYGFRGHIEQKQYFIDSIPPALANLSQLMENTFLRNNFPYLCSLLLKLK